MVESPALSKNRPSNEPLNQDRPPALVLEVLIQLVDDERLEITSRRKHDVQQVKVIFGE